MPGLRISSAGNALNSSDGQADDTNQVNMSGTLVSSLVWVPRGKAALEPKRYALDDEELQRVGKLGGPGVLEKLREEMEGLDVEGGEWEE